MITHLLWHLTKYQDVLSVIFYLGEMKDTCFLAGNFYTDSEIASYYSSNFILIHLCAFNHYSDFVVISWPSRDESVTMSNQRAQNEPKFYLITID